MSYTHPYSVILTPDQINELLSKAKTPDQLKAEAEKRAMAAFDFLQSCIDTVRYSPAYHGLGSNDLQKLSDQALKFMANMGISTEDYHRLRAQWHEHRAKNPDA